MLTEKTALAPGEYAFTQTKNEFPEDLEIDKLLNR